jgi:hypothetical protein
MASRDKPTGENDPAELAAQLLGMGDLLLQRIIGAHPTLPTALSIFDPLHTAAIFGGLLTTPELQCNCCRLEALAHLAVAFASGRKKVSNGRSLRSTRGSR